MNRRLLTERELDRLRGFVAEGRSLHLDQQLALLDHIEVLKADVGSLLAAAHDTLRGRDPA